MKTTEVLRTVTLSVHPSRDKCEASQCLTKCFVHLQDLVSRFATCKSRDPESYKLQFLSLRGCHAVEARTGSSKLQFSKQ